MGEPFTRLDRTNTYKITSSHPLHPRAEGVYVVGIASMGIAIKVRVPRIAETLILILRN
jgi:hypothetical protein